MKNKLLNSDILKQISGSQIMGIVVIIILMVVTLGFLTPYFFTATNLNNILLQTAINIVIGVGETFVILTGGIDLGVGSVVALSAVIMGSSLKTSLFIPIAILIGILIGALSGAFNGILVSKAKIPAFIVTLGMMSIARGLALLYTGGRSIYTFPKSFRWVFGNGKIGLIPMPAIIAGIVVLVAYFILHHTKFGRYVYAIGGNYEAAKLSGIKVKKTLLFVYMIAGITYSIGAAILIGRLNSAQPIGGTGYELDAIAAVVIGGTSLSGGAGTVLGTVLGALVMGILRNGLNLLNVSSYLQQVFIGSVIILAVLVDQLRKRKK